MNLKKKGNQPSTFSSAACSIISFYPSLSLSALSASAPVTVAGGCFLFISFTRSLMPSASFCPGSSRVSSLSRPTHTHKHTYSHIHTHTHTHQPDITHTHTMLLSFPRSFISSLFPLVFSSCIYIVLVLQSIHQSPSPATENGLPTSLAPSLPLLSGTQPLFTY